MTNTQSDIIHLQIMKDGNVVTQIGSWGVPPNERNGDFDKQGDVGWHIFMDLRNGADSVRVVRENQIGDLSGERE